MGFFFFKKLDFILQNSMHSLLLEATFLFFLPNVQALFSRTFYPSAFLSLFHFITFASMRVYTVTGYDLKMSKKILFFFIVMLLARKLKRSRCKIQCRYKCFPCQ